MDRHGRTPKVNSWDKILMIKASGWANLEKDSTSFYFPVGVAAS
jgi:hypothetical protein